MSSVATRQITYNTVGNIVTLFFQWLITMLIPKVTNFSDAGVFAIALSVCSIMNVVATLSLNQYQIADQYEKYSENDYFVCRSVTISLSFMLCILWALALGYSLEQTLVILGYMLYRNCIHFAYLHTATLQIEDHLDHVGKCMILEGVISFVSFMASFIVTGNLMLSVAVMALLGGGSFLLSVSRGYRRFLDRRYPKNLLQTSQLKALLALGLPLMASSVAPIIITALPKIALQFWWGDELVGIFSTLTAPTIIVPTLVAGIFTPFIVFFSNLCKTNQFNRVRASYLRFVLYILAFGMALIVVSILLAEPVFRMLYGEQIVPYVKYFHILMIGIVVYSIGMTGLTVLIVKDQGKIAAVSAFLALIVCIITIFATVPNDGMVAATYGLLISYAVFAIAMSCGVLFVPLRAENPDNTD